MKVTIELTDYSKPVKEPIVLRDVAFDSGKVELEVDGVRHVLSADELISAVKRARLNVFGE